MRIISNKSLAIVSGTATTPFTETYSTIDGPCYKIMVDVARLSGTIDSIPVIIPESCLESLDDPTGRRVFVKGSYMSRNRHTGGKHHLDLFVYADVFNILGSINPNAAGTKAGKSGKAKTGDTNSISLTGHITRTPVLRTTGTGRDVADVIIAINGPDPRYPSYIPCLVWGHNAKMATELEPGDLVQMEGRAQSRLYNKAIGTDKEGKAILEQRTAYEVSCSCIELISKRKDREEAEAEAEAAEPETAEGVVEDVAAEAEIAG